MVIKNIYMSFEHSPITTVGGVRESTQKRLKNGNNCRDLDIDLVTLELLGYVDLVYIYPWYEYH